MAIFDGFSLARPFPAFIARAESIRLNHANGRVPVNRVGIVRSRRIVAFDPPQGAFRRTAEPSPGFWKLGLPGVQVILSPKAGDAPK